MYPVSVEMSTYKIQKNTKKGKGLPVAENNPTTYHAPGVFNPLTGEIPEKQTSDEILKFQDVFGETLV